MTRALLLLPLAFVIACDGASSDADDDAGPGDTDTDAGDGLPPLTAAPTGDFTCFTPAPTYDAVTWAPSQSVRDDVPEAPISINVEVLDFQEEEPTSGRTVELWYDDVAEGAPDASGNVDNAGIVPLDAPACEPIAYRTKQLPGLQDAVDTYKAHQIFGPTLAHTQFQSVSFNTYVLIPTVLGLVVDPTRGVIAGTLYDCTRDPDTLSEIDDGKVENARVRIYGCPSASSDLADCDQPVDGVAIHYFVENFPNRDQEATSEDGLWGVFNVPEGNYRIDAYALIDGEEQVLGSTTASVFPDSINIANIWSGYPAGVKYPETCLAD